MESCIELGQKCLEYRFGKVVSRVTGKAIKCRGLVNG